MKEHYQKPGTREKISLAHTNIHPSDETRRKMSLAHRGEKTWNYGKHRPRETIEKIVKSNKANFQDPEFIKRFIKTHNQRPNKAEIYLQSILDKYLPNTYKYVGNFQVNIGGKFPDFININGKKEVIELFGSYWHSIDEVETVITYYKQYGFSCIIIWEEELKDVKNLLEHIRNGSIYQPKHCRNRNKIREAKKQVILDPITKKFSLVGNDVKNGN